MKRFIAFLPLRIAHGGGLSLKLPVIFHVGFFLDPVALGFANNRFKNAGYTFIAFCDTASTVLLKSQARLIRL